MKVGNECEQMGQKNQSIKFWIIFQSTNTHKVVFFLEFKEE